MIDEGPGMATGWSFFMYMPRSYLSITPGSLQPLKTSIPAPEKLLLIYQDYQLKKILVGKNTKRHNQNAHCVEE